MKSVLVMVGIVMGCLAVLRGFLVLQWQNIPVFHWRAADTLFNTLCIEVARLYAVVAILGSAWLLMRQLKPFITARFSRKTHPGTVASHQ